MAAKVSAGEGWPGGDAPSRFAGAVLVETVSGRSLQRLVTHPPGSPRNPMSSDDVVRKFGANASAAIPEPEAEALAESLLAIRAADRVGDVLAPLAAAPAAAG